MKNLKSNYDIVFWGHGHVDIERFLPLMVSLKAKEIKTALFYQNFDFRDGLTITQLAIAKKYGLDILDFSLFLDGFILQILSLLARVFKRGLLHNKFIGLRSKIVKFNMSEKFIRKVVVGLNPRVSFFDSISLTEHTDYPYGSYYIKKVCDELNIRSLSIYQGGTGHLFEDEKTEKPDMNFGKMYLPNEYEKNRLMGNNKKMEFLSFGDPRFDSIWRKQIKDMFSREIKLLIEEKGFQSKIKILYLMPNLESIGEEKTKYQNLEDVIGVVQDLGNAVLLIKPHPRYRYEDKIRRIAKKEGFRNFVILENDPPLVCYSDYIDFVISVTSTAVNDFLPEDFHKVIIYDNVSRQKGLINIYRDGFNYFEDYEGLSNFLKKEITQSHKILTGDDGNKFAKDFCKKWVSSGREMDKIIDDITTDISKELEMINNGRGQI